jgi:hypothetical protein
LMALLHALAGITPASAPPPEAAAMNGESNGESNGEANGESNGRLPAPDA